MSDARGPNLMALAGLLTAAGMLLVLAGAPLYTDDLWWHLKAGETYASEGPWPAADPMLHTAHEDAPVQHEWLFGVAVHGVDRALGSSGLRALHVLLVAGVLLLVWSLSLRAGGSALAASAATTIFVVLAWWRLAQLRPDLVSIAATFAVYRLLLEGSGVPSWRRVTASVLLFWLWANMHSLFAIGLALLIAALLAELLRALLPRLVALRGGSPHELPPFRGARAMRLGVALSLATLATVLNPRGVHQHTTFFTSTRDSAIWQIRDEWIRFSPFDWSGAGFAGNPLTWIATDLLLAAFVAALLVRILRLLREPRAQRLEEVDTTRLGLGLASAAAIAVSIRFLWMGAFPLFYLLGVLRSAGPGQARLAGMSAWSLAGIALLAALALPGPGGLARLAKLLPASAASYLDQPYVSGKYFSEGVHFLRATGLEGNLFNNYWLGGFLGYWLAPRMRTFVDSRVEHYPPVVLAEVRAVTRRQGVRPGEGPVGLLERRRVDVFFGVGVPPRGAGLFAGVYNAANLEGAPGWILISRSIDHALWLRAAPRNRENLRRLGRYFANEGVPWNGTRGLDPARVIEARPDWAARHRMLPVRFSTLLADRENPDPERRFRAQRELGLIHVLLGAYSAGLSYSERASRLRPDAPAPLRAQIYALLRLDRTSRARALAERLRGLAAAPARAREIGRLVAEHAAAQRAPLQRARIVDRFPLLLAHEERELSSRFASPRVASRAALLASAGR